MNLARKLAGVRSDAATLTAAQRHERDRKTADKANAIAALQWDTCDLSAADLADAIIATLEARPGLSRGYLEALERRVGRLAVQVSGHKIVDNARRAGL